MVFPAMRGTNRCLRSSRSSTGRPPANTAPLSSIIGRGADSQYSGGGYTIMQQMLIDLTRAAIRRISRRHRPEAVRNDQQQFRPAAAGKEAQVAATPYRGDGEPVEGGPHTYPELAAAGLWTTPTDLAHFCLALLDAWAGRKNPVLSQSTTAQMLTPGLGDYGLGLIVRGSPPQSSLRARRGQRRLCERMIAFESGDGAVVMTNAAEAGGWRAKSCAVLLPNIGGLPSRPRSGNGSMSALRFWNGWSGTYEVTPKFRIRISREGERLLAQATGQERI